MPPPTICLLPLPCLRRESETESESADFFTNPSETVRLPDFENRNNTSSYCYHRLLECVIYFAKHGALVQAVGPTADTAWCLCCVVEQVFLVRKIKGSDAGTAYAMKVLKKATLKGEVVFVVHSVTSVVIFCCCIL